MSLPAGGVRRRTLGSAVTIAGMGLFSGRACAVTIGPGSSGLVFRAGSIRIPALTDHLVRVDLAPGVGGRNTCVGRDGLVIRTVEHVLSALVGLGVTDAEMDVEGGEIPILDGSALGFVEAIQRAGVRDADGRARLFTPRETITVREGAATITCEPADEAEYTYDLDYGPGAPMPRQSARWRGDASAYASDVAPARTFCLEHEARAMRSMGLFSAFSPKDLLVIGAAGPVENSYRMDEEPARHKLLDLIGDLALAGVALRARIRAARSGHALNQALAREIAARA